jgi:hypothetical protein
MATAYTSLLGLALPVTGELAGTWGDTVNNSITSLLDSAVSGTTTLSTDADVTLTTTTGASNQARQAILLCSGARTVLRNITAPAQSKLYVVINSTTGGFGVVIRGVGPTTGVTVANGKTAVVVWNGSDFVEVAPATATTATNLAGGVAGSLPYQTAASTTTFLGIGTANYVLTSTGTAPTWTLNTGTGSVVRATSPTLATPTFTTSATVPLLIGGTTTTSTLALRSTSGVGTTGADIIFQTGNNGATEAMRVLNSGNVGIGTATPGSVLDVNGNTNITGTLTASSNLSATNSWALIRGNSIAWPTSILGQTAGRMVLAQSSGNAILDLHDDTLVAANTGPGGLYFSGRSNDTGPAYLPFGSITALKENATQGNGNSYMQFKTSLSGTGLVEAMRITSAGLVGIGTAAPAQLLHIASGDATALIENTAATSNATLQLKYPSRTWALANRGADLSGAFAIRDVTAGADRLIINSTGNLLIGGASPIGSSRVELLGTNDATSQISLYRSDLAQRTIIGAQYIGTFTNTNFDFYTNSISRLSITSAGIINIPNLTASQAVFTDASKNLVSNAITGSGSVVMSTSPTLVTPILGTPTSGTLTSCTGLPLTTGVTGTLPVANGGTGITSLGTGVATWLGTPSSANLLAAMTDETGTGALVFATSPTLVTPTFTTSATFPLHIGGTTTTSTLTLRSTSGVGATGADIIFQVGNNGATEAMRVLNSGNVGIGTNAPDARLHVLDTSAGGVVWNHFANTSGAANATAAISLDPGNNGLNTRDAQIRAINNGSNQIAMSFFTANGAAPAEAMRIDASGNLLVGTTNNQPGGATYAGQTAIAFAGGTTKTGINIATTSASASKMIEFQYTGFGVAGVITTTTSSTSYGTSSDYRLKENVTPITGALDRVSALKPVTYTWKVDGSDGEGFIAHELQEVCPLAVIGEKDAVGKDGKPVHQGIDPSKIIGLLTAAIQEQQATITALTNRISALEAK